MFSFRSREDTKPKADGVVTAAKKRIRNPARPVLLTKPKSAKKEGSKKEASAMERGNPRSGKVKMNTSKNDTGETSSTKRTTKRVSATVQVIPTEMKST